MTIQKDENSQKIDWRKQTYIVGALVGAVLGFLSAYLFAREADQNENNNDKRPEVPPTTLLNLAVSTLTLVRKIAETGKKTDKKG